MEDLIDRARRRSFVIVSVADSFDLSSYYLHLDISRKDRHITIQTSALDEKDPLVVVIYSLEICVSAVSAYLNRTLRL